MRRAAKMDTIHADIRELFRAHGVEWTDTAAVGHGLPDAIVCWNGRLALLEIKSGAAANKRKGKTADAQRAFASRFPVRRVTSLQEAEATVKWLKGALYANKD
jgi:hypothetical protein